MKKQPTLLKNLHWILLALAALTVSTGLFVQLNKAFRVGATTTTRTWTSQNDFTYQNGVSGTATTRNGIDLTTTAGDVKSSWEVVNYSENFSSTTKKDTTNTTSGANWDTSNSRLQLVQGDVQQTQFTTGTNVGTAWQFTYGQRITPSQTVTVDQIGFQASGTTGTADLRIYTDAGVQLAQVNDVIPGGQGGLWRWATLSSPVTLTASTAYRVSIFGNNVAVHSAVNGNDTGTVGIFTKGGSYYVNTGAGNGNFPNLSLGQAPLVGVRRTYAGGYADVATVQSTKLNTATQTMRTATLTRTQTLPTSTTASYYLSANGGSSWEGPVTSGSQWTFTTPGTDLRWKAVLSSGGVLDTPVITNITVFSGHPTVQRSYSESFGGTTYRDSGNSTNTTWASGGAGLTGTGGTQQQLTTGTNVGTAWQFTYGLKINPSQTVVVDQIGFQANSTTGTADLRLYTEAGTLLAQANDTVPSGQNGLWRWVTITPVTLTASTNYVVSIYGNNVALHSAVNSGTTGTAGIFTKNGGYYVNTGAAQGNFPNLSNGTQSPLVGVRHGATFTSSASVQSVKVNPTTIDHNIVKATLTATATTPTNTSIVYYMSADGGVTWDQVTSGTARSFKTVGSDLRWKAALATTDGVSSPVITSISITYHAAESISNMVYDMSQSFSGSDFYGNLSWNATVPSTSSVEMYVRAAATQNDLASAVWIGPYTTSPTTLDGLITGTFLELRILLFPSTDFASLPSVQDVTFTFTIDDTPPTSPTTLSSALNQSGGSTNLTTDTWYNYATPYFSWTGATDPGSNLHGYCVLFTTNSGADPGTGCTKNTSQTAANYTAGSLVSGNTYYLLMKSVDTANNVSSTTWNAFTYKYDSTNPTTPASVTAVPTSWSNSNSFSFNWADSTDSGGSGMNGYKYKVGGSGSEVTVSSGTSASSVAASGEGTNTFYVKATDVAGNEGSFQTVNFYYDATSPSSASLSPSVSGNGDTNSFSASWTATSDSGSGLKGYYYTVNQTPTASNVVLTSAKALTNLPLATKVGTNTFYVIAVDNAGNADFDNPASTTFSSNVAAISVPQSISVTDVTQDTDYSLAVQWRAPATGTPTKYEVYRTAAQSAALTEVQQASASYSLVGSPTTRGFTDTDLDSTKYYYYKVRAINTNGAGIFSSIVGGRPGTTDRVAPQASSVTNTTPHATSATVTWTTDEAGDSLVEYGKTNSFELGLVGIHNSVLSHSVELTGLAPGTTYYYRVYSRDSSGNRSDVSSTKTFTTTDTDDSTAPSVSSLSVRKIATSSALVSWDTDEASTGKVEYGTTSSLGSSGTETDEAISRKHTVIVDSLSSDTLYYYRVVSIDSAGNQTTSSRASFTTIKEAKGSSAATPKISNLSSVSAVTATSAVFSWTTDRDSNSYVTYGTKSGTYTDQRGDFEESVTTHSITLTGLTSDTSYYYKVKSKDTETGNVGESSEGSFKTKENSTLSDVVISDITLNSAILSWTTNVISSSTVKIGASSKNYASTIKEESTDKTLTHVARIANLNQGTKYYLRIEGTDSDSKSFASDEYSFITNALPVVSGVTVRQAENAKARITWSTNVPTDSTVLYGKTQDSLGDDESKSELLTDHDLTVVGLDPDTKYFFKVRGRDKLGNSADSSVSSFTTGKDSTAPVIADVKSDSTSIGSGDSSRVQLIVTWITDEPSTSKVEYGSGVGGENLNYPESSIEDSSLNQSHVVILGNLKPNTTYHFRTSSKDKSKNGSHSEDFTILTPPRQETAVQTIVKTWEETFSWVPQVTSFFNLNNLFGQ